MDIRETPAYTPADAARYLRVPVDTLRHWLLGYPYETRSGKTFYKPLIKIAGRNPNLLSFINLVESHVLSAIRRKYRIPMPKIRTALNYLEREYRSSHPLVEYSFKTDGLDLFTEQFQKLEILSQDGQLAMREVLEQCLSRIEWDEKKLPFRYFPYTRDPNKPDPRLVIIDPSISFGRPVILGTGIPTSIIAERFEAGEKIEMLVEDYGRTQEEIEEAIRWQFQMQAA